MTLFDAQNGRPVGLLERLASIEVTPRVAVWTLTCVTAATLVLIGWLNSGASDDERAARRAKTIQGRLHRASQTASGIYPAGKSLLNNDFSPEYNRILQNVAAVQFAAIQDAKQCDGLSATAVVLCVMTTGHVLKKRLSDIDLQIQRHSQLSSAERAELHRHMANAQARAESMADGFPEGR